MEFLDESVDSRAPHDASGLLGRLVGQMVDVVDGDDFLLFLGVHLFLDHLYLLGIGLPLPLPNLLFLLLLSHGNETQALDIVFHVLFHCLDLALLCVLALALVVALQHFF